MSEPIPFPETNPAPAGPPENPLLALVWQWRLAAKEETRTSDARLRLSDCADELENLLAVQGQPLPASLVERVSLAVLGGYFTPAEAQHLIAAVSCLAALTTSQNIHVMGELSQLNVQMQRESGGALKVFFFANQLTRDAQRFMNQQARALAARRPNGVKP